MVKCDKCDKSAIYFICGTKNIIRECADHNLFKFDIPEGITSEWEKPPIIIEGKPWFIDKEKIE